MGYIDYYISLGMLFLRMAQLNKAENILNKCYEYQNKLFKMNNIESMMNKVKMLYLNIILN